MCTVSFLTNQLGVSEGAKVGVSLGGWIPSLGSYTSTAAIVPANTARTKPIMTSIKQEGIPKHANMEWRMRSLRCRFFICALSACSFWYSSRIAGVTGGKIDSVVVVVSPSPESKVPFEFPGLTANPLETISMLWRWTASSSVCCCMMDGVSGDDSGIARSVAMVKSILWFDQNLQYFNTPKMFEASLDSMWALLNWAKTVLLQQRLVIELRGMPWINYKQACLPKPPLGKHQRKRNFHLFTAHNQASTLTVQQKHCCIAHLRVTQSVSSFPRKFTLELRTIFWPLVILLLLVSVLLLLCIMCCGVGKGSLLLPSCTRAEDLCHSRTRTALSYRNMILYYTK